MKRVLNLFDHVHQINQGYYERDNAKQKIQMQLTVELVCSVFNGK